MSSGHPYCQAPRNLSRPWPTRLPRTLPPDKRMEGTLGIDDLIAARRMSRPRLPRLHLFVLNNPRFSTPLLCNAIAERREGHALVPAPHDLVSGRRVMLAILVPAEQGDEQHRTGEVARCGQRGVGGVVGEETKLDVAEQQLGVALGDLAPEQRHEHEAPRDDGLDGQRALEPLGAVKAEMLGPASRLQHPEEVLHAPAPQIVPNGLEGGLNALDAHAGEQSSRAVWFR